MKEKRPVPHPLMNRSYNPEIASTFLGEARAQIARQLPIELMKRDRAKYDAILDRISIEAWRYSVSTRDWKKFPSVKTHRDNLSIVRDGAEALKKALEACDTETYRRLYQQLGQKHDDDHYQRDAEGLFDPIDDEIEEYEDGKQQYAALEAQLSRIAAASRKIAARLPNVRSGKPPRTAPPLETSYAHALADIWCHVTGEPFVAAASVVRMKKVRSNQSGARFLEVVLTATIAGIRDEQIKRLIKKVGHERRDEAKKPRSGRRDKSGRSGRRHY